MLVVIAVFVSLAGSSEDAAVETRSTLAALRVDQAMSRDVHALHPTDPLGRAVELTLSTAQANFPLVAHGRLVGLLTDRDLLIGLREFGPRCPTSEAMRTDVPIPTPTESLFDAEQRMAAARVHSLPIVIGGRLAGLLTAADFGEARRLLVPIPPGATAA